MENVKSKCCGAEIKKEIVGVDEVMICQGCRCKCAIPSPKSEEVPCKKGYGGHDYSVHNSITGKIHCCNCGNAKHLPQPFDYEKWKIEKMKEFDSKWLEGNFDFKDRHAIDIESIAEFLSSSLDELRNKTK